MLFFLVWAFEDESIERRERRDYWLASHHRYARYSEKNQKSYFQSLPTKKIRINFINNLAPIIQPVLKVSGTKTFINGVKIKVLEPIL
jgi:hypothetical protein